MIQNNRILLICIVFGIRKTAIFTTCDNRDLDAANIIGIGGHIPIDIEVDKIQGFNVVGQELAVAIDIIDIIDILSEIVSIGIRINGAVK